MNLLLVNGHEYWESSPGQLNETLLQESIKWFEDKNYSVKTTHTNKEYDLEEEVLKILWADIIIYFSPVYWMSIPASMKRYFDHVYAKGRGRIFENDGRDNGGQYGTGGLMSNKKYMLITTWNAPSEAFNHDSQFLFEGKNVDDVFFNFHSMQKFIGMKKLKSFSLFDVKRNPKIEQFLIGLRNHLNDNIND